MDKKQIRKEIAVLINSIKEHSDNIGEKEHIPQLELELILSKIEKLYQKSIVFNFLHSEKETGKRNNDQQAPFLVNDDTKAIVKKENSKQPDQSDTETHRPEVNLSEKKIIKKEEKKEERKDEKIPAGNVRRPAIDDIRSAIGINDKFMLANELFNGNIQEYEIAVTQLNTAESMESALEYFMSIQQLYNWDNENESVKMLYDIVERRYN